MKPLMLLVWVACLLGWGLPLAAAQTKDAPQTVASSPQADHLNVRDFGAKGDGQTDDTDAFQTALDALSHSASPGVLKIPQGNYLISRTLVIEAAYGLTIQGVGAGGYRIPSLAPQPKMHMTNLIWTGKDGGVLFEIRWSAAMDISNLRFIGRDWRKQKQEAPRAGILMHFMTRKGAGNTIHHLNNLSFIDTAVGMQMGTGKDGFPNTDSDVYAELLTFRSCDTGFKSTHLQALNYQCRFLVLTGLIQF